MDSRGLSRRPACGVLLLVLLAAAPPAAQALRGLLDGTDRASGAASSPLEVLDPSSWGDAGAAASPLAASPQIKGISLKKIEDTAKAATKTVVNAARTVVDRAGDDLRTIFDAASDCLAAADKVRLVFSNQVADLTVATLSEMARQKVIPVSVVKAVQDLVHPQLEVDPKPRLWRITNLGAAVWSGASPSFAPVTDPQEFARATSGYSFLLVHGAFYSGKNSEVWKDFVRPWERAVRLFKNDSSVAVPPPCAQLNCNIFVLTYDTSMTDEAVTIITKGFESVLAAAVTGTGPLLTAAVFWRELERRAKIAGEFLAPFVSSIPPGQDAPFFLFSHSLGTFAASHMAQVIGAPTQPDAGGRFRIWFAAASAVPATAFTPGTGIFDRATRIVTSSEGPALKVLYSNFDSVLTTLYFWANGQMAMGAVGSRSQGDPAVVENFDVTSQVQTTHGSSDGYWAKVGDLLRMTFGTQ